MAKQSVGLVGVGLMGHGIAQTFAAAGHRVRVHDAFAGIDRCATIAVRDGVVVMAWRGFVERAYGIAVGLENLSTGVGSSAVVEPGWYFRITAVITMTGGTMFLMWLGEQITARGVGNGISLIIFVGIVARFPQLMGQTLEQAQASVTMDAYKDWEFYAEQRPGNVAGTYRALAAQRSGR